MYCGFYEDPVQDLLALNCSLDINFDKDDSLGWFCHISNSSVVAQVSAYKSISGNGVFTRAEVHVCYWN